MKKKTKMQLKKLSYQVSHYRDELIDLGIELKDNPDGSTGWYVKI